MQLQRRMRRSVLVPTDMFLALDTPEKLLEFMRYEAQQHQTVGSHLLFCAEMKNDGPDWERVKNILSETYSDGNIEDTLQMLLVQNTSDSPPTQIASGHANLGKFKIHNWTNETLRFYAPQAQSEVVITPEKLDLENLTQGWKATGETASPDDPTWVVIFFPTHDATMSVVGNSASIEGTLHSLARSFSCSDLKLSVVAPEKAE